ncbi:NAD-dependent epimerase/dehydratase family protein [Kitasatospora sp. NPDC094016]|uniref:NAD-dependent epimerase/dehydratase family protein n=1 Tax=Kitasatospora sp. NPDC094016 TaxID=3154986 RepID=UPI003318E787
MSKVVVTGGGGFIGSHIVDRLCAQGHRVLVVDDFSTGDRANLAESEARWPELSILTADVVDESTAAAVEDFAPEVLLLLAAQFSVKVSMRDPLLDAQVNVIGLVRMLEAARRSRSRKVVFASSGGTIYGPAGEDGVPIKESAGRVPSSFYGLTKSVAVDYLRLYHETYGLDYVALALGNVFGPRQTPFGEAGVVSIFAQHMLSGQTCVINGDGLQTRDYVHVSDVADAFVRAVDQGHGLINIGKGQESSVLDIHQAVEKRTGRSLPPRFGPPLAGEVRRGCLDPSRAQAQLGWTAGTTLEDGVDSVVSWLTARPLQKTDSAEAGQTG